jgi:recombination protein RecR
MIVLPSSLQRLVIELSKLPSIGERTASRLAYHLVSKDRKLAATLSEVLQRVAQEVTLCETCYFLAEKNQGSEKIQGPEKIQSSERIQCTICRASAQRDCTILCVVEKPMDVLAIERMGEYRGLYHVLHGLWSPLRGTSPQDLRLKELLQRVATQQVREVILATAATVEGDATALYVAQALAGTPARVSRLAQGMPKGGELEYADEVTLSRALQGRSVLG